MKKNENFVNLHAGHRKRLRENVLKNGLNNMHDHQVLEFLLTFVLPQKDTNELAHELIRKFGTFAGVLEAELVNLKEVKGVGEVVAHFLYNLKNFFYYYEKNRIVKTITLHNTSQTYNYLKGLLSNKLNEELYLIGLDSQNRVVYSNSIEQGTANHTKVTIRKITTILINNNIHNVVVAHNHPSGYANPSADDDIFTKSLFLSLNSNDIYLVDHLIIGENEIYSYHCENKLDDLREEFKDLISPSILAQPPIKYEKTEDYNG